jgi:hypothetical protein
LPSGSLPASIPRNLARPAAMAALGGVTECLTTAGCDGAAASLLLLQGLSM